MRRLVALSLSLVGAACGPGVGFLEGETACADAEVRLGRRVCVHGVDTRGLWEEIAFVAAPVDQARTTTYLVPARADARLPTVFVDAAAFEAPQQSLHFKFLTEVVESLALIEYPRYLELTLDPVRREFFAGSLTEFVAPDSEPFFGFTVWDRGTEPDATITCAQFEDVYAELSRRVTLAEVRVVPANALQRTALMACDLPLHDPALALDYEPYTLGRGCGRLRRYTTAELAVAEASAEFGFQDVLVLDEAPLDIATVISGIVTGTRQGELSHLNVRSASRGTPNCYVKDAHALLAAHEGSLVALRCGADAATVEPIDAQEAAACQEALRPDPVAVVPADHDWTALVDLLQVPTDTAAERRQAVARFGSKGANLAALYQRIDPGLGLPGFLIPLHYHAAFMRGGTWEVDLGDGPGAHSFEETVERWLSDPDFDNDGVLRQMRLGALQTAMQGAPCDPELLAEVERLIVATQGDPEVMVRFRSSSNAEDALDFNGAGLYDSTSACAADTLDTDPDGPSRCDPDRASERGLCRGLTRVWASLWNHRAVEERAFHGIDHRDAGMGVLVNTRTKGELANIVAFSGNPLSRGDDRFLVNAQAGELDVVAALPGVWPEKDLLTVADGAVTVVERARGSTELPEGEWVLSDGRLAELGAALADIVERYPIDADVPSSRTLLLDSEWKIDADGRLFIKQVRPFLR